MSEDLWSDIRRGVQDGRRAFVGPAEVEICILNRCNLDCVLCWGHSPLLSGPHRRAPGWADHALPFPRVIDLLSDLAALGTEAVLVSGGGEPLLYPRIFEVLGRIRDLGMRARLLTNLTTLTPPRVTDLLKTGVHTIQVSLWAATAATYLATHPNRAAGDFERVLVGVGEILRRRSGRSPFLLLGHVLCRRNAHEIERMIQAAREIGADGVTFQTMDPIPECTESLLPSREEYADLARRARDLADSFPGDRDAGGLEWHGKDEFLRRVNAPRAHEGIYDAAAVGRDLPPCTIGWTYARIQADGSVCSCCKATRVPVGNLHRSSFREIWFGPEQEAFRRWSRAPEASGRFSCIPCRGTCDNVGLNRHAADTACKALPCG